jgi:hypothetical protein
VYFPTWSNKDLRLGAPEECALRPPADSKVTDEDMVKWVPESLTAAEPALLKQLRESGLPPAPPAQSAAPTSTAPPAAAKDSTNAIVDAMPAWLTSGEDCWDTADVDFLHPTPGLRVFGAVPRRCELDSDWILRPDSEVLVYERDPSLRTM